GRRLDSYRRAVEGGRLSGMLDFPGVLDSEETLSRLASASLCVLPAVRARDGDMDGIPVCLMEAAAMGVPIVSARLSGIPELVVHGETGLLADPGDPGSLADSLQWAADHPAEMERMAARGRKRAAEMFDSAAGARAVLSMMEETAGRREP
ncbi:MAG: glycosyltransferase, partial [Candidatus Fermentibacterota bacterium]